MLSSASHVRRFCFDIVNLNKEEKERSRKMESRSFKETLLKRILTADWELTDKTMRRQKDQIFVNSRGPDLKRFLRNWSWNVHDCLKVYSANWNILKARFAGFLTKMRCFVKPTLKITALWCYGFFSKLCEVIYRQSTGVFSVFLNGREMPVMTDQHV